MYADCGNLYSAARELVNVSSDVLTWVQSDFQGEALSRAWAVNYWLLAWVVFGLLLLSGCILPYLYRSKRHVMRMISLGRLVKMSPQQTLASDVHILAFEIKRYVWAISLRPSYIPWFILSKSA
jgi:hypothetical protein